MRIFQKLFMKSFYLRIILVINEMQDRNTHYALMKIVNFIIKLDFQPFFVFHIVFSNILC